jgi:hypothetical protein
MTKEEEVLLERRLTTLEMGIEEIKDNSGERLEAIMNRFDKIDRRYNSIVAGVFAMCLTFGGIYLDAYFNKDGNYKSLAVITDSV